MSTLAPPNPPQDDPELLIKEARQRQLRRRLLGAAGVALTAAIGLSIYALVGGNGTSRATRGSVFAGVPPCRAAQLATVAEAGPGDAPLNDEASIQLVNRSSHACVVPTGVPKVGFTLRGRTIRVGERAMPPPYTGLGTPAERVLAPGRKVVYILKWLYVCPRPAAEPTRGERAVIILRFENGPRFAMPEGTPENIPIVPGCGELKAPQTVLVTPLLRVTA